MKLSARALRDPLADLPPLETYLLRRIAEAGLAELLTVDIVPANADESPAIVLWEEKGFHLVATKSPGSTLPDDVIRALCQSWQELYDASIREEQLLEELATDWESLQSLYDLSVDLQAGLEKDEVLNRILQRAVASVPGGSALLFLRRDQELSAIAGVNTSLSVAPGSQYNLIRLVADNRQAVVLSGLERIRELATPDAPWAAASNLAMAPIIAPREGLFGVIAVWSSDPKAEFNSNSARLLEALGHQSALILESDRLTRTLRDSERLQQEMQIGSLIQQMLLISEPPRHHAYFDVAMVNVASQTVDGDFLDVYAAEDGTLDIVVGDVMGKGIPAALIGAATKTHLLRATAECVVGSGVRTTNLADVVNRTAMRMTPRLMTLERFVTLSMARLDAVHRIVRWVDCGHTSTLHFHASNSGVTSNKGEGLPLGVLDREVYIENSSTLEPGDILLFYSDGVTEASNIRGEMFGEERLAAVLSQRGKSSSNDVVAAVRNAVIGFTGSDKFADDFTCVAVRVVPENEWPENSSTLVIPADLNELDKFHKWIETFLRGPESDMDSDTADLVHLALTETVTNSIRHGCEENIHKRVSIHAKACELGWIFEIEDDGAPRREGPVQEPAFDGSRSGGFGLFIVEQVMDRQSLTRLPEGHNRLVLTRLRNKDGNTENERYYGK